MVRLDSVIQACTTVLCCGVVTVLVGCSGGGSTGGGGATPTPTPAAVRLIVSDNSSGTVSIVNATTDGITHTFNVPSPGKMVSAGGVTLIQSTLANSVTIFDNTTETIRFTVPLATLPVDIALTPDGKTGWVALSNGTVETIDTATGAPGPAMTVIGGVQRLIMGPQGTKVLAFNDALNINFTVVFSPNSPIELGNLALDHPTYGVFESDDNHFLLLNCGKECGGTQAGHSFVNVSPLIGGPAISIPVSVSGATVGLLSGTTDFVAGSPATGLNAGTVQTVNIATDAVGAPVSIADGRHNLMALTANSLFIGATGCTLGAVNAQNLRQGCLTVFDTAALKATPVLIPAGRANGDVTGMAALSNRGVVYVVQGGVLDIVNVSSGAISTTAKAPTFAGTVFGVVQLSP